MPQPAAAIAASASLELRPAIAFERAERVAGQAFAVHPHQRRLPVRLADDQGDMLGRVAVGAEGDDLAFLGEAVGQPRARDDAQVRAGAERHDVSRGDARLGGAVAAGEQGRQQPGQPRQAQRRLGGRRRAERRGLERALERSGEVERRIGDRGGGVEVDPGRAADQHRLGRQRLALVGELQRRRAVAGDEQGGRRVVAVEGRQPLGVGGLDGEEGDVVDRHRPAAPEGVDRAGDVPRAHQSANSVISGTWSDGRVQLRQGS